MFIVCFCHVDKMVVDEYQYTNLKDAICHYEHFLHDDSRLYKYISLMSFVNHSELLIRLRSFSVCTSFTPLKAKDMILERNRQLLVGKYVVLFSMQKEPQMNPFLCGTVNFVDDQYQIHMRWKNGSTLPLVIGIDDFEVVTT